MPVTVEDVVFAPADGPITAYRPANTVADGAVLRRDGDTLGYGQVDLGNADAVTGALPIANGGTGATAANAARNNLLPAQTGNAGKVLTTDGTDVGWVTASGGGITALTGDVTASGTGSVAATIANDAVTDAKLRNSAALSVIGRSANSTGDPADIAAASDGQALRRSGTSIGFGALDLANANAVTGTLPVANGGTGQTTASAAINALLPSQTGNAGKTLTTDGSNTSWAAPPAALPIGTIIDYGASSLPSGYLACDGSAVSRSTYADLYTAIGTTWGVGDGSTTFNVPDLRGRTAIGSGTGSGLTARTLAGTGGAETHQLTVTEMPSHVHGGVIRNAGSNLSGGAAIGVGGNTTSAGGDGAHNNMQPFSVVTKAIKAFDVAGSGSGTAVGPAPGPPTSLTAAATGTSGQVLVSWTAPTYAPTTVSAATPTDYLVEYSTSNTFSSPHRVASSGTGTSKTVTGLTNGTTYYFRSAALANSMYGAFCSASASAAPVTYLIYDTFTASNGTSPTGRSPDIGSAPTTALLGSWAINSNAVAASGSGQTALLYNPGTPTQTVEVNVTSVGTGANGSGAYLYARWTNSSNYYAALFDVAYNNVAIYKTVGGTSTLLGSAGTFGAGAAVLKFEVIGTALKAYVNGSVIASVTDSSLTTGNYAGVGDFYGSFNYNYHPTFDNLRVY